MIPVQGKNKGKVTLYALSTCIWCRKTKKLLLDLGVGYEYEDVDLLEGDEEDIIMKEIERFIDMPSFPLIVINDKKVIRGYDEKEIIKELGK